MSDSSAHGLIFYTGAAFLCGYVVFLCLHIATIIFGQFTLHVHRKRDFSSLLVDPPGVTIIKPIIGSNDKFKSNLETFFQLKYPKFEILICLGEHENPPSLRMVEELREQYPNVDTRVFIGASQIGLNPKINNMYSAYKSAKYDLMWISDSRMKVHPETLVEMASSVNHPKIGAVHQVPVVESPVTMADYLEQVYFSTQHARMYMSANLVGQNCLTGMSCMIKKGIIDDIGGLEALAMYLAEDFFMGKTIIDSGFKMRLSSFPGLQVISGRSFTSFKDRMIRWGKLRTPIIPIASILEPMTECFPLGVIVSWCVWMMFSFNPAIFFLAHCMMWFIFDLLLMYTIKDGFPSPLWKIIPLWLIRELVSLPIILLTHSTGWTVEWGGNKFRLKLGGKVERIT